MAVSEDQYDAVRTHTMQQAAVATAASRRADGIDFVFWYFFILDFRESVGAEQLDKRVKKM